MNWQCGHFYTEIYIYWQCGHFSTETYTFWLCTGNVVTSVQKHTPTGYALAVWSLQYRNIHLLFKTVTKTCKFYSAIPLPHPPFPLHPEKEQKLNMRQDLNDNILLDTICDPFSPIEF